MSRLLRGMGHRVITSRDYAEASAIYQRLQGEIDMMLADVSLPGYYGCELAKSALRSNPAVTVLYMSADAGAEACRFYGIEPTDLHFLKKPFRDAALVERVRQLLEAAEPKPAEALACAAGQESPIFEPDQRVAQTPELPGESK